MKHAETAGDMHSLYAGQADAPMRPDSDQHILRIRRLARQLFQVGECLVVFHASGDADDDAARQTPQARFCLRAAKPGESCVALDAAADPALAKLLGQKLRAQIGFFASHPVFGADRAYAGSLCLIDSTPRSAFEAHEQAMLADLAVLVERELLLRSMDALQLELQKKNKNLRRKSLIDPLIGTWNRGAIMRILTIEAIRCDKAGMPLSLIVADIDFFKKINDSYGHPAGDAVLVKVASRLRSCIRPQEALGRYGGEEFLIVLPGSSHQTALAVAERMRETIAAQPEVIGSTALHLTISAGVASTDMFPAASTEELISRADVALYAAKDGGRNRVVNATPELP